MAKKRMFSLQIVDTDAFLDMPLSTQALYFHLSMRADDDGFVSNPKKIMKMVGCQDDDIKVLFSKRFILGFESGVIVIKHWRLNNFIRKDRHQETSYIDEKKLLIIKENGSYTEVGQPNDNQMTTKCQHSIDKIRLDKVSIGEQGSQENLKKEANKLLEYFYDRYTEISGNKPVMTTWAKYNKNAQRYIKSLGLEKMKDTAEKYFKSTDSFIEKNNYSIDVFLTDNIINKLN